MRMKLSMSHVLILGVLSMEGISYSAEPMRECKVPFKFDSDKVSSRAVEDCVNKLGLQSTQEKLEIVGSATPEGTTQYNQRLSERRAENLRAALLQKAPNLKVDARGIGEIPQNGLIARIVAEEGDTQEAKAVAAETVNRKELTASIGVSDVTPTKTETQRRGSWRIGPRLGQDHSRIEDTADYFAPGLELAYVPSPGANPHLRTELGAIGTVYMKGDERKMSSLHFAPMVGYQSAGGYIAGVRGLLGVLRSDISDDSFTDAGGEIRLGREMNNWSAFLAAGQTSNVDRIGLDLGWRF